MRLRLTKKGADHADVALSSASRAMIMATRVPERGSIPSRAVAPNNNRSNPPDQGNDRSGIAACWADDVDGLNNQEAAEA